MTDEATKTVTAEFPLPGARDKAGLVEEIIRVDQAGEYGAVRIYKGQMAVLGKNPELEHMLHQEEVHLETFSQMARERRVRPTLMTPLWHVGGFIMGAGSALLGEKAAHACTQAVEETIDAHYAEQVEALGDDEKDLRDTCEKFRQEELEHRDLAVEHGAEQAVAYPLLYSVISNVTKFAIDVSKKI